MTANPATINVTPATTTQIVLNPVTARPAPPATAPTPAMLLYIFSLSQVYALIQTLLAPRSVFHTASQYTPERHCS